MFSGYFIKFGSDILPMAYMKVDSYKVEPNKRLDLDSFQDQLGVLNRNVLEHTATKAEWQSPPMKYDKFRVMMNFFHSNYSSVKERKVNCQYYDFETDSYKDGVFYMPDYAVQVYYAEPSKRDFMVREVTFKIIEY